VFGAVEPDYGFDEKPIGDSSQGVLDAGVIYEETMWNVTSAGNDRDYGAVAIRALTSNDSYYVGWDGESFIGIASEDGLDGGYDCSMAGVFYYSFPNSVKSTILNVNPVGPAPEDGPDTYYYNKVLKNGQEDVIFDKGPVKITSYCSRDKTYMKLKLNNTVEDMLVFGEITYDSDLDNSPIGNSSDGVLDAGVIYEETMWSVTGAGNDFDYGAVAIRTLTSDELYYIGWDGESFVGIASEDGLAGGYDCAMAGVFHYSFPETEESAILNMNSVGPGPEDSANSYFHVQTLNDGEEGVIFDKGPVRITSHCVGNETYMKLKLNNTAEDMLVFGSITDYNQLDDSPIGNSSYGVLDAGVIYEEIMWYVYYAGNDYDNGAVAIRTLTSDKAYYVGWDGESFVGIASEDGLAGGYDCAMAGVFHYSFPA